ncbi:hypothetical protein [Kineosporia succinea]|uniref:Peptidase inhibitor family I36 n=1 Tax=Kineosporia succinea TaxID=84632 RepID=A0ABT9PCM9_9ACTN|nr:hypothetical protein [Kineosporia succinea]MDP9830464.1 hypothetical protein [Kineosporia succinea]
MSTSTTRHHFSWWFSIVFLTLVAATGTLITGGSPASASTSALGGCSYPYVCLYTSNGTKVGQFKDVTSGWQLFSRRDVTQAKNTRNDDVVYFKHSSGYTSCLENNTEASTYHDGYGPVVGLQINDSSTCYQGSGPPA